jgi:hypothetical protein
VHNVAPFHFVSQVTTTVSTVSKHIGFFLLDKRNLALLKKILLYIYESTFLFEMSTDRNGNSSVKTALSSVARKYQQRQANKIERRALKTEIDPLLAKRADKQGKRLRKIARYVGMAIGLACFFYVVASYAGKDHQRFYFRKKVG